MSTRRLILGVAFWCALMATAYFFTIIRVDHAKGRIRDSGIEITQRLSKLVRLPLLETNSLAINALLVYAAKQSDIVYASVVDHRNGVVAFTGDEQATPLANAVARSSEQVSFLEGELATNEKIFSFASDVTYAGTKIGRIYIALPAVETLKIRNQFKIAAVLICAILLILFVALRYRSIETIPVKLMNIFHRSRTHDVVLESSVIICPMCGAEKPFSNEVFKNSNLDRLLIIRPSRHGTEAVSLNDLEGIRLSELAKREGLSWLRRQVILRCSEIIGKLAA
jgi:hypothetical protein